ncbi:DUF2553 family protein [Metabacillus sp. RGM 3146]|uniref:DUF2553 family protein n=1 Tax=Metabacillus sp. RGM 3146 TaxID=3401092 RepID=UPI003B992306
MNDYHKLEVTKRVTAKVQEEFIELYVGRELIGKLVINEEGKQYDLTYDYLFEDGKIFKLYERNCEHQQYAEGCDMGWC